MVRTTARQDGGGGFDPAESPSTVRRVSPPHDSTGVKVGSAEVPLSTNPRAAALAFLDGSLHRWTVHELVTWLDFYMIRTGRLVLRRPFPSLSIHEPDVGTLSYGAPDPWARGALLPQSETGKVVRAARQKVVGTLGALIAPSPDDRFVQAAIYEGRVQRMPGKGRRRDWGVLVSEDVSLSSQVLALVAADLLVNREDYDRELVVCEVCGTVEFWPERAAPQGCRRHPEGLVGVPTQRSRR